MSDANEISALVLPASTYMEQQAHRTNILRLPGRVDRWLTANSRSPNIAFLRDYLMLLDIKTEYVTCFVERVHIEVNTPLRLC